MAAPPKGIDTLCVPHLLPCSYEKLLKGCSHQRGVFRACRNSEANLSSEMTRNSLKEIKKGFPALQTAKTPFWEVSGCERHEAISKNWGCVLPGPARVCLEEEEQLMLVSTCSQKVCSLQPSETETRPEMNMSFLCQFISSTDCTQNLHLKRVNDSEGATREPDFKRAICCLGFNDCAPR